jgi:hypothetical protein
MAAILPCNFHAFTNSEATVLACREVLLNPYHLDSSERKIESTFTVSESTKFADFSLPTTPPPHATFGHKEIV